MLQKEPMIDSKRNRSLWAEAKREAEYLVNTSKKSESRPFPSKRKRGGWDGVATDPGVYAILDPNGIVAHVGRTANASEGITSRLKDHLAGQSSFVDVGLKGDRDRLRRGWSFAFRRVDDPEIRARTEVIATAMLRPLHLGTGKREKRRGRARR